MDCTNYVGFMVAAVATGSVVLVTLQAHRRLASDVLRKLDEAIGQHGKSSPPVEAPRRKKKVRFADEVLEHSSNNEEYRRRMC